MSLPQHNTDTPDVSMDNLYTRAFWRELGAKGFGSGGKVRGSLGGLALQDYAVVQTCHSRPKQQQSNLRAARYVSLLNLERTHLLNIRASEFLVKATPTVGQLIDHTLLVKNSIAWTSSYRPGNFVKEACVKQAAWQSIYQEHLAMTTKGAYGFLSCDKPDDVVCMMYENFSSLLLFVEGPKNYVKIRQPNKLLTDFGVDVIARCETRTDWHFVTKEESRLVNLFGNGRPKTVSSAHNINDPKIKQDQRGGMCITALGRFSSFVTATGVDSLGLG
jgi:hypothetical protein